MPPGGAAAWISAYIAQSTGTGGVYLTFAKAFDRLDDYYKQLLSQREEIDGSFGTQWKLTWERTENKVYIGAPNVSFKDLKVSGERQRVVAHLADMTNRMVNVFRHRLEAMGRESE